MRPTLICHMMSTVDGRLLTERWSDPFDGTPKERLYEPYFALRRELGCNASIIGRVTMQRDFAEVGEFTAADPTPEADPQPFVGASTAACEHTYIVLDSTGRCRYADGRVEGCGVIAVLGRRVAAEYLRFLREKGISYLFAGEDGRDIGAALETLRERFGYRQLLLEGGGTVNGSFLEAGLIDGFSLLLYPGIDGAGGRPAIVEYVGPNALPAAGQSLELTEVRPLEHGLVWLRYRVHR